MNDTDEMEIIDTEETGTIDTDKIPALKMSGPGPVQVQQNPRSDGLLGVIERIATDPNFDVAKMEALLKMRAEEEDRQRRIAREDRADAAKRAWLAGFAKVQAAIGPIIKNRSNEHTRSTYATLEAIEKAATPVLTSHGFSTTCVPVPCEVEGHIRMRLTIGHAEGHEQVYEDDFPLDAAGSQGKVNKTPIQAKGSTQTYARRYLKASALDLAFMDDNDGNREAPETISADQFRILRDKLDESGMPEPKFFAAFGHRDPENADLHEFPARFFDNAVKRLDGYMKAKEQAHD